MAVVKNTDPSTGTLYYTFSAASGTAIVGEASPNTVGGWSLQFEGIAGGDTFFLKGRIAGAGGDPAMAWVKLGYFNTLSPDTAVAGTTAISADGIYVVRCDHGIELQLDFVFSAGTAIKVLAHKGIG